MAEPNNWQWTIAALVGASGVALGAFGAHGLQRRLINDPKRIKAWETAAHYQIIHAVPMLLAASHERVWSWAALALGTTLFSGSIYGLMLRPNWKFLGPVTPIGGSLLIVGWLALAWRK